MVAEQDFEKHTGALMRQGVRLLNFWRLGDTDAAHTAAALDMMGLPEGAAVVDLGCGIGEFARQAHVLRPDLRFTLVNHSAFQLSLAPQQATHICGDMLQSGLSTGGFDAVILAYAMGHGDVVDMLEEAHRLLKAGGKLFLHDIFAPDAATAKLVLSELDYHAHDPSLVREWAQVVGFDLESAQDDSHLTPGETVSAVLPLLERLGHCAAVFVKADRSHKFAGRKVALQFSGGKDSMACLYQLRPFLRKYIDVYWLNTGELAPETLDVVAQMRDSIPRFIEVNSDVRAWRKANGIPSDLVPAKAHVLGVAYGMNDFAVTGRFDCCYHNLMRPMHERMLADGVDLVIRGTKRSDTGRVPADGRIDGSYEIWLPLIDWSHEQVFSYLDRCDAPVNPIYAYMAGASAPECLGCTAWWDDGKAAYLRERHPKEFGEYRINLSAIRAALQSHLADLDHELAEDCKYV